MSQQHIKDCLKMLYKRHPMVIDTNRVFKLYDLPYVQQLENDYDEFIDTNQHSLALYNLIDNILEIRDAIIIRRCQLQRYYNNTKIF
jgi:hypothetical protein